MGNTTWEPSELGEEQNFPQPVSAVVWQVLSAFIAVLSVGMWLFLSCFGAKNASSVTSQGTLGFVTDDNEGETTELMKKRRQTFPSEDLRHSLRNGEKLTVLAFFLHGLENEATQTNCCNNGGTGISQLSECAALKEKIYYVEGNRLELRDYHQPTFKCFKAVLEEAKGVLLQVSSWYDHGFIWKRENSSSESFSSEAVFAEAVPFLINNSESCIECIFLNAPQTLNLGQRLIAAGVHNVVCWAGRAENGLCAQVAIAFHAELARLAREHSERGNWYKEAFQRAGLEVLEVIRNPESGSEAALWWLSRTGESRIPSQDHDTQAPAALFV